MQKEDKILLGLMAGQVVVMIPATIFAVNIFGGLLLIGMGLVHMAFSKFVLERNFGKVAFCVLGAIDLAVGAICIVTGMVTAIAELL